MIFKLTDASSGRYLVLAIFCVIGGQCEEVLFDYLTNPGYDVLTIIDNSGTTYPVCSTDWQDASWDTFVCNQLGFGGVSSSSTLASSNVTDSQNGYYVVTNTSASPNSSVAELITFDSTCASGAVVVIQCQYNECGKSSLVTASSRRGLAKIIGGVDAAAGNHPWQVAISNSNLNSFCGGSLLTEDLVLTAAHCVDGDNTGSNYFLEFGITHLADAGSTWQYSFGSVVSEHPAYDSFNIINDVALITLASPVTFTYFVRPVCLPISTEEFPVTAECYTSGWGSISTTNIQVHDFLQETPVPIVNDGQCASDSRISLVSIFSADEMICAGNPYGNPGICNGDSGGPLVCKSDQEEWILAGVTSWGVDFVAEACVSLSVYAEVAHYISWMESTYGGTLPISSSSGFGDYDYNGGDRVSSQIITMVLLLFATWFYC